MWWRTCCLEYLSQSVDHRAYYICNQEVAYDSRTVFDGGFDSRAWRSGDGAVQAGDAAKAAGAFDDEAACRRGRPVRNDGRVAEWWRWWLCWGRCWWWRLRWTGRPAWRNGWRNAGPRHGWRIWHGRHGRFWGLLWFWHGGLCWNVRCFSPRIRKQQPIWSLHPRHRR